MRNEKNQTWKERSRVRRYLCLFLVAVLVTTQCTQDWGVSRVTARATCPNHQAHDDSCSYAEETRVVQACNHAEKCDETCASRVLNCTHTHVDGCTIVDSEGELQCTHSHTNDCYECQHEHDADCGYKEETVIVAECDHTCESCKPAGGTESVAEYEDETTGENQTYIENKPSDETKTDGINPQEAVFYKNSEGKEETETGDIVVALEDENDTLVKIERNVDAGTDQTGEAESAGDTETTESKENAREAVEYELSEDGRTVTLKKETLEMLEEGSYTLYFVMESGAEKAFALTVADTAGEGENAVNQVAEYTAEPQADGSISLTVDYFPDDTFRARIGEIMRKSEGDVLTKAELDAISIINLGGRADRDEDGNITEIYRHNCENLQGIEFFENLTELYASYGKISSINLANNSKLETLTVNHNQLKSNGLDLTNNRALIYLDCGANELENLDVRNNSELGTLACYQNKLTNLDLSVQSQLYHLNCGENELSSLTASHIAGLKEFYCHKNKLQAIDIAGNVNLEIFNCCVNQIKSLDLTQLTKLTWMDVGSNQLENIDVRQNTMLQVLGCYDNKFTELDVSNNAKLYHLNCGYNQLKKLTIKHITGLKELFCSGNQLTWVDLGGLSLETCELRKQNIGSLSMHYDKSNTRWINQAQEDGDNTCRFSEGTTFAVAVFDETGNLSSGTPLNSSEFAIDESGCFYVTANASVRPEYVYFEKALANGEKLNGYFQYNSEKIGYIDLNTAKTLTSKEQLLDYFEKSLERSTYGITVSDSDFAKIKAGTIGSYSVMISYGDISENAILEVCVGINEQNFPDQSFLAWVKKNITQKYADHLTKEELEAVTVINFALNRPNNTISNLAGLEYFSKLREFNCTNQNLVTLDMSKNAELYKLQCNSSHVEKLIVSQNTKLDWLECGNNPLTELDISNNPAIWILNCCGCLGLKSIDLSKNLNLKNAYIFGNGFSELDLSKNKSLNILSCGADNLTELDLSANTKLTGLYCADNQLTELDLTNNTMLKTIKCNGNSLTNLEISHLTNLTDFDGSNQRIGNLSMYYEDGVWKNAAKNSADISVKFRTANETNFAKAVIDSNSITKGEALSSSSYQVDQNGCFTVADEVENPGNVYFETFLGESDTFPLSGMFTYETSLLEVEDGYIDVNEAKNLKSASELLSYIPYELKTRSSYRVECADFAKIQAGTFGRYPVTLVYTDGETEISKLSVLVVGVKIDYSEDGGATYINFPDSTFRNHVRQHFDTDGNGFLTAEELNAVEIIDLCGSRYADPTAETTVREHWCANTSCTSVKGIEYFGNLVELYCSAAYSHAIDFSQIDVRKNLKLKYLCVSGCKIRKIDVSKNTELEELGASECGLENLNIRNNVKLKKLVLFDNQLKSLNLRNNVKLQYLDVYNNHLEKLDVSKNTELLDLRCGANPLSELDVRNNTKLTYIGCNDAELHELDLTNNRLLTGLVLDGNHLTALDLSGLNITGVASVSNQKIDCLSMYLDSSKNVYINGAFNAQDVQQAFMQGTRFSVVQTGAELGEGYSLTEDGKWTVEKGKPNPGEIHFENTNLGNTGTTLTLSGTFSYKVFDIAVSDGLIDFNDAKKLSDESSLLSLFVVSGNNGSAASIACAEFEKIKAGNIGQYEVTVTCGLAVKTSVLEVGVNIDAKNFPDAYFCGFVKRFDTDQNGKNNNFLTEAELNAVKIIDLCQRRYADPEAETTTVGHWCNNTSCLSVKGVEYFKNLEELYCSNAYNGPIEFSELDISQNKNLKVLCVHDCQLESLDISYNTQLEMLGIAQCQLKQLDISKNAKLKEISAYGNKISNIDIAHCTDLVHIDVAEVGLKEIDTTNNTKLQHLGVHNNSLTELDVSHLTELRTFLCYDNNLTELDVSHNTKLEKLYCGQNRLTTLELGALKNLTLVAAGEQKVERALSMVYDNTQWVNAAMEGMEPVRTFYYHTSSQTKFYKNKGGALLNEFEVQSNGRLKSSKVFDIVDKVYFTASPVDGTGKVWASVLNGTFSYAPQYTLSAGPVIFSESTIQTKLADSEDATNVAALAAVTGIVHSNPDLEEIKNAVTISMDASTLAALKAGTVGEYTYTVTLGAVSAQGQIKVYADGASGVETMVRIPASIELKRDYTNNQAVSEASIELYGNAEVTGVEVSTASVVNLTGADKKQALTVEVYDSDNQPYTGSNAVITLDSTKLKQTIRLISTDVSILKAQKYTGTMEFEIKYNE